MLNGIGSLQYTGTSILMSQPETGALITEYTLTGGVNRTFGRLRRTGHEDDRELHLALNSGIPLVDPTGGFFFVFQTGEPVFQKYDAAGQLVFERRIEGREIDASIAEPADDLADAQDGGRRDAARDADVRTAAVDRRRAVCGSRSSCRTPTSSMRDGDKIRTVQFRGAGMIAPTASSSARRGVCWSRQASMNFPRAQAERAVTRRRPS